MHTCVHGDFENKANLAFRIFADQRKIVSREAMQQVWVLAYVCTWMIMGLPQVATGAAPEALSSEQHGILTSSIQRCFEEVSLMCII